jgi:predicted Rossmann fold flavoprotein
MGLSVANAEARINTTKLSSRGPILITHWGLSGPAIIRLSAWAAEYMHRTNYSFTVAINRTTHGEEDIRTILAQQKQLHGKQRVWLNAMFAIPLRLWQRLCELAEIDENKIWSELPQRHINKLVENLIRCSFEIKGKTTFKEEFVTCGGVDLKEIDLKTMESNHVRNLFFAGEVINIDGETGGFNFQAAWSTANTAAVAISQR